MHASCAAFGPPRIEKSLTFFPRFALSLPKGRPKRSPESRIGSDEVFRMDSKMSRLRGLASVIPIGNPASNNRSAQHVPIHFEAEKNETRTERKDVRAELLSLSTWASCKAGKFLPII